MDPKPRQLSVLIVAASRAARDALAAGVSVRGHEVFLRSDAEDLVARVKQRPRSIDLVVLSSRILGSRSTEAALGALSADAEAARAPVVVAGGAITAPLQAALRGHPRATFVPADDIDAFLSAVRAVEAWDPTAAD